MSLEIHTLALLMSICNFLQVIALYVQYRVDKSHAGPGWWVLGMLAISTGYGFNYLRDHPSFGHFAVAINNFLFFGGIIFLYAGVVKFLGSPVKWRIIGGTYALYQCLILYFTFSFYNWGVRRAIFAVAVGAYSVLIARALLTSRMRSIRESSRFVAAVFLFEAVLVAINASNPTARYTGSFWLNTSWIQVVVYSGSLTTSTLWTFGFIIMLNQRLVAERRDTIAQLQEALDQIKTLTGILPICSHCKKIRGDEGGWEPMEAYVTKRTEAEFSHGICPDCMEAHFPTFGQMAEPEAAV